MILLNIPGFGDFMLQNLVLDFNGTLAMDGKLLPGVKAALKKLSDHVLVHVVTADTFCSVAQQIGGTRCQLAVISSDAPADESKAQFVRSLGAETVAAIGNGRNDALMLQEAAVGIAVMQQEGASARTLASADVVIGDILRAFELLLEPRRLVATLRN
ncbi:ATPase P [Carpediemonas membranifera]|uniref:ATPase P n=1 Tax=Carpediemonas membranifera TaxID=201153 RepID=A0A8J6AR64_9EUKA|nr:ATPase P [Carpediemonas membranifera]|eukprot:KAG9390080.1 ATPase P [Carpediemonas membranifera]